MGVAGIQEQRSRHGLPPPAAHCVVRCRRGSARSSFFAGTIQSSGAKTWITDLASGQNTRTLHSGLQGSGRIVWQWLMKRRFTKRQNAVQALFVAGHSLGWAMAIIARGARAAPLKVAGESRHSSGQPAHRLRRGKEILQELHARAGRFQIRVGPRHRLVVGPSHHR